MASEQCSKYQFKLPFYPGESCEDLNPETHDKILLDTRWSQQGVLWAGSSKNIYNVNNPETADKSGYYCINDTYAIDTLYPWCG